MQGLKFFTRTSSRNTFNIASYHNPQSWTWRWLLHFSFLREGEARIFPLWYSCGRQRGVRIPFLGMFTWATQEPMWKDKVRDAWRESFADQN